MSISGTTASSFNFWLSFAWDMAWWWFLGLGGLQYFYLRLQLAKHQLTAAVSVLLTIAGSWLATAACGWCLGNLSLPSRPISTLVVFLTAASPGFLVLSGVAWVSHVIIRRNQAV